MLILNDVDKMLIIMMVISINGWVHKWIGYQRRDTILMSNKDDYGENKGMRKCK